jgi:hypothetical protein
MSTRQLISPPTTAAKTPPAFTTVRSGLLQRKCSCGGKPGPTGECAECRKKRETGMLQRKATRLSAVNSHSSEAPAIVHEVLRSPGQPLDSATRAFMEPRFDHDFSRVRVHTDAKAADSARAVNALAYTVGRDVVFGDGQYVPRSDAGERLLAHELAHVIQQNGGKVHLQGELELDSPASPSEAEAVALAKAVMAGNLANIGLARESGLERQAPPRASMRLDRLSQMLQRAPKRSGKGTPCAVSVCWFPIQAFGLGKAGAVHGVINVHDSHGASYHVEVDPTRHTAPGGPHSHVVIAGGTKSGKNCEPLSATCAETDKIVASAKVYEVKDVTYDAVSGPNSNSFVEWTLNDSGINTSAVHEPLGAVGWSYYISNPGQRTSPPVTARPTVASSCKKTFSKATSFRSLIDLVREAEVKLNTAGISDQKEQIKILRGLYYGTTWSKDYEIEKSLGRIIGFQAFTQSVKAPMNPATIFDCGLYRALRESQDIKDGSRQVDFGHLIIALDARNAPVPGLPFITYGGTGTELVTWLGDLGGGAGSLAVDRVSDPSRSVGRKFSGSDYGGSINLEGDVAGFVVGRGGGDKVVPPAIPPGKGIADILEDYLTPGTPAREWKERAKTFLKMQGGKLDAAGNVTNKSSIVKDAASQIESFACQYLAQRADDHRITEPQLIAATDHIRPASEEMAQAFFDALEDSAKSGNKIEAKKFPSPKPKAPGACTFVLTKRAALKKAAGIVEDIEKKGEELLGEGAKKAAEVEREAEKQWESIKKRLPF